MRWEEHCQGEIDVKDDHNVSVSRLTTPTPRVLWKGEVGEQCSE